MLPRSSNAGNAAPDRFAGSFRRLLKSATGTAALQVVSNGAGFLTALLLARFLGPDGYGLYAFSFAWAGVLVLVATLGADRFLVRGIAVYEVQRRWPLIKGLLKRTNQLVLLSSGVLAIAGAVIAITWMSPSLRLPFSVAMLLVPFTALTLLRQGAMQAFGRVVVGQLPENLIRPILILSGIIILEWVAPSALSPASALIINVSAVGVAFAVGTALLLRHLPEEIRLSASTYETRWWLRSSVSMMLIAGGFLLNSYVGILAIGTLGGPAKAGVYAVVQNSTAVVVLFLTAANMALAPVVARLHARGDRRQLELTTQRVALAGFIASAPFCIAFIVFPDAFLHLFGSGFQTGSTALAIVAIGQLVSAAAGPSGNVLMMTGHERIAARVVGIAAAVNLVLAVLLVPPLGVTGSGIAFAASVVLWNVALVLVARRRLGINVTAFQRLAVDDRAVIAQDACSRDTTSE